MNHSKIYSPLRLILIISLTLGIVSCENSPFKSENVKLDRQELYSVMKDWYLWYDSIPDVNPNEYPSLQALLDAIVYKPLDKWSDVMGTEQYNMLYRQSQYIGHGFGPLDDPEGNLWVGFVFDGTTAGAQGLARGWQILSINGVSIAPGIRLDTLLGANEEGVQNSFQFRNKQGGTVNMTLEKEIININPVLFHDVYEVNGKNVGYLAYQQFLYESKEELDEVFKSFQEENVTEVIIDLRYNPGGQINVAQHLASLIAGQDAYKGTFVKYVFNAKHADRNHSDRYLGLDFALESSPDRVFFITTGRTASSSEVLINGLKPYLEDSVLLVGNDTYGKPVGSFPQSYYDSTVLLIAFAMYNRYNEGEYFDGFPADVYLEEDIMLDLGDPEEVLLKEVLYFIENNQWSGAMSKKSDRKDLLRLRGIQSLTGAI